MRCSRSGLDDVQLAADAGEGIDGLVQVLARMRRADLGADAGLVLRHDGEEEPDRVDAFLEQPLRELLRQRRVVEHHRADRVHARSEEHTSELQSLMRISYAVFCLKKKKLL